MTPRDNLRDNLKRYLEAGSNLSKHGRNEVEGLLRDLFDDATSGRERVEDLVEEFTARSRRSAEQFVDMVRAEIRHELAVRAAKRRDEMIRALATKGRSDLADLVDKVGSVVGDLVNVGRSSVPGGLSRSGQRATDLDGSAASDVAPQPAAHEPAGQEGSGRDVDSLASAPHQAPAKAPAAKKASGAKKAPAKAPAAKAPAKAAAAKKAAVKASPAKKAAAKKSPAEQAEDKSAPRRGTPPGGSV